MKQTKPTKKNEKKQEKKSEAKRRERATPAKIRENEYDGERLRCQWKEETATSPKANQARRKKKKSEIKTQKNKKGTTR